MGNNVFSKYQNQENNLDGAFPVSFLINEPEDVYHSKSRSGECLSSHKLAEFRKNPLLYYKKKIGLVSDDFDSPAYQLGRAAHKLILEGREAYEATYAFGGPINPKTDKPFGSTTKAFMEWAEQIGKPVLSDDQATIIGAMHNSIRNHMHVADLLNCGIPEGVVRVEYMCTMCQCRIDWFNPLRGIVDLKTCECLDWFADDARRYEYMHQLAFYRMIVARHLGLNVKCPSYLPVHIIAVEKREPFRCGVWFVSEAVLDKAQRENDDAIHRLKNCICQNSWPTGYEEIRHFDYL